MIPIEGIDLVKLTAEAKSQTSKAAESQVRNWIKGLFVDATNLRIKAQRLREEAVSIEVKAYEKESQLAAMMRGEWDRVDIEEIRLSDKGDKQ